MLSIIKKLDKIAGGYFWCGCDCDINGPGTGCAKEASIINSSTCRSFCCDTNNANIWSHQVEEPGDKFGSGAINIHTREYCR